MVIFVAGLVDDVMALKPSTKLIVQLAMASALVAFDFRLHWIESRLFDSLLTMIWIVGLTNAFNLLDNMDGLCAGTAVVVALMMVAGLWSGVTRDVAGAEMTFLSIIAGAAAGFLVYNFPPASIFMGDCGSLMLGFSLAAMTLGSEGVRGSRADVLTVMAAPVFVLLLPIFDTTLVTVARILSGRSPAIGGRDHSSHRLVAIGLSERGAVFLLWGLAAAGGAIGLVVRNATGGWSSLVGGLFLSPDGPVRGLSRPGARLWGRAGSRAGQRVDAAGQRVHAQTPCGGSAGRFRPDRRGVLRREPAAIRSGGLRHQRRELLRIVADRDRRPAGRLLHRRRLPRRMAFLRSPRRRDRRQRGGARCVRHRLDRAGALHLYRRPQNDLRVLRRAAHRVHGGVARLASPRRPLPPLPMDTD